MVAQPKAFRFFALRNYQADVVGRVFDAFNDRQRTLVQIATGSGKTAIGSAVADRFVRQNGRVLWLAHREELLTQAYEKLEEVCSHPVSLIQSGKKIKPEGLIQVASVQTLARRKQTLEIDLIVTDEAHHATSPTYRKVFDLYPDAYHLGLSATPKRLDGKGLDIIYDRLVCGATVSWLMENQYLSPYRLFVAKHLINTKGVRTVAGDFNPKQLHVAAMSADVMGEVVPSWREYADGRPTVVFCCDVEHSQSVCDLYRAEGVTAAHLDGDTPVGMRRQILADFRAGNITVLTNCGIVSEGLDIPGIECVQILRPTQSLSLYLQMVGRSLRPGKDSAYILDHTKNWKKHGLPDDEREWSLDGTVKHIERKTKLTEEREVVTEAVRGVFHDDTSEMIEITREQITEAEAEAAKLFPDPPQIQPPPPPPITPPPPPIASRLTSPVPTVVNSTSPPNVASPFPWIDRLLIQQSQCGYKKGWVSYRVLEELREKFDEFDSSNLELAKSQPLYWLLNPLKYTSVKLQYHPNWADRKYEELLGEFDDHLRQQKLMFELLEIDNAGEAEILDCDSLTDEEKEANFEDLLHQAALNVDVEETAEALNDLADEILAHLIHPLSLNTPTLKQIHANSTLSFTPMNGSLFGNEIIATLHLDRVALPYTWFLWMQKHQETLLSNLKIKLDLRPQCELKFTFSCAVDSAVPRAAQCPCCADSNFHLHPALPPHFARLECSRQHFIQWVSESSLLQKIGL